MRAVTVKPYAIGVALFGLGIASTLVAQSLSDSPRRVEQKRADLAGAPGMEVIVSVSEYQPGETLGAHTHHGIEAGYVLQGAMTQLPGHEPTPMPTGTTIFNLRDARHGGFKVVGDSSLKLFTVHVVDKGRPLYDFMQ